MPVAKASSIERIYNRTAMVLYMSIENTRGQTSSFVTASDLVSCRMLTRPHLVDTEGKVRICYCTNLTPCVDSLS
jgi:hypothetical protein